MNNTRSPWKTCTSHGPNMEDNMEAEQNYHPQAASYDNSTHSNSPVVSSVITIRYQFVNMMVFFVKYELYLLCVFCIFRMMNGCQIVMRN